jgi:hypothetical protein
MQGEGFNFFFSLARNQLLWSQRPFYFGRDEQGVKHTFSSPHSTIIEHLSPFTLDPTAMGNQPWVHLIKVEKARGGFAPEA